ncbi:uncharacterized protein LOC113375773 [Ctenocephalides felis]|uniref:uncharacterized protein LOC113375773 n=1 Tax=Ctenocephalides felis TaxID=7515 RepID=UPI000E6E44F7|nr:uncharacterized protein LOC113375773 [Ctenocephalides felis]
MGPIVSTPSGKNQEPPLRNLGFGAANLFACNSIGATSNNRPRNNNENLELNLGEPTGLPPPINIEGHKCRFCTCNKYFATVVGRGVHEQKTHKEWYDEELAKIVPKKARWAEEEQKMMAKEEALLIRQGVGQINNALFAVTPGRTMEAIKGQRRSPKYKGQVAKFLAMPVDQNTNNAFSPATEDTSKHELANALKAAAGQDADKFNSSFLKSICLRAVEMSPEKIERNVTEYLNATFPIKRKVKPQSNKRGNAPIIS